ncbi:MAG: ethanolamine utilization protein EutJ [Tissierellia bacterium]|nr:ethanolamine utilization protein EutJ [Tissierellia bacterium]
MDLERVNQEVEKFHQLIERKEVLKAEGRLYTGVDLGTSSIVLSVVDEGGQFVAGAFEKAHAIRDGIVVDYVDAVRITKRLKEDLEARLGQDLDIAAAAVVPGADPSTKEVVENILEGAGFFAAKVFEEPEAAAFMLGIDSGAVVDIGGGTTGISLLEEKKLVDSFDEATGGHHMNLVLSGAYQLDYDQAEEKKIRDKMEVFPVIKPVAEKMATIVKNFLAGRQVEALYLVGGATDFPQMEGLFASLTGIKTQKPKYPLYITPMGIALALLEDQDG